MSTNIAIVTGAANGIGYEICKQLLSTGDTVILNDVDKAACEAAARVLDPSASRCIPVPGDAGSLTVITRLVDKACSLGTLRKCVANAGITAYGDFLECTEEKFDRLVNLNLKGSFFLLQKAAQQMIAQRSGGRLILMSSVTAVQAHPSLVAYGMTKAGLRMLARALVPELTPHGILVNAIAPGAVQTERTLQEDPNYAEKWGQIYPTGRTCLPEDIAKAALFLLSDQNEMINGQTLIVDGGWTTLGPVPKDIEFPT